MNLSDIADQYAGRFLEKYSQRLLPSQLKALKAIQNCRTPASGMTLLECNGCKARDQRPMSCGHRHCNRCQNTDTSEWLARQSQKLLPVDYFMVTFTLPEQLRSLAWQHQRQVYDLLFKTAADTLKQFGANAKNLDADLGMTGVLHTHSRRLDYHPMFTLWCLVVVLIPEEENGENSKANTFLIVRTWPASFVPNS